MRKGIIRPLVICIFQKDDSILVAEGYDPVKKDYFYRPIGGGIEFGEKSSDALIREVDEEIDATICDLHYIGTIENLFTFSGDIGHEIVQVYDARFVDGSIYEKGSFIGKEDNGTTFKALWIALPEFRNGKSRLVPEELLDLIQQNNQMV
ncbi:NUDIX hydrolase [Virgibacillus necropolis]|uniref:DNA mismatch repair protein MutT n=1 Tax=Virgibacillus necropolis TaxID=163877 RepID=A0A221MAV1_9BACI|nr:NUDIX domain-containing protein [Virgibacillus necropolis]ASN04785.1 DNA mismatch repair protein MutT [Virgibacillus necropolis]